MHTLAMSAAPFSLAEVLTVAKVHPFYSPTAQYPPDEAAIQKALDRAATDEKTSSQLLIQPLLQKERLYVLPRLQLYMLLSL